MFEIFVVFLSSIDDRCFWPFIFFRKVGKETEMGR